MTHPDITDITGDLSATFELHPRLIADTLPIGALPLCLVLLMNDRQYPWLILVPQRAAVTEIHHLGTPERQQLIEEISLTSAVVATLFAPDKINIAALGNIVSQLHVHLVARFTTDPAWPQPVWGRSPPQPYAGEDADAIIKRLRGALPLIA